MIAGAAAFGGVAATVTSPAVGWISDRYGVRVVLSVSIVLLGALTISLAWATIPVAFYLAYGLARVIFSSPLQIASSVVVTRWFVRMRGRATGILGLSHSAGMTLFPLLASMLIILSDWHRAWIYLGILVWIGALLPVTLLIVQSPEDVGMLPDGDEPGDTRESTTQANQSDSNDPIWTTKEAMRTPALWMLAGGAGLLFLMQSGINVHMAAFFQDKGLTPAIAAAAISMNAIFTGVGSIAWGWLLERFPVRFVFAAVAGLMGMTAGLLFTTSSLSEAMLFSGMFGLSIGGILVVPPVAIADYFGRQSLGAIRGVTEPLSSLGQAIGAILSGIVFDQTGSYEMAFVTFAIIGGVTMFLFVLARPPRHASLK